MFSTCFRNGRWFLLAKRTCDVVAGVCGLVLASPLMLASTLLLKLESPHDPVLYHQVRVGLHGRPFTIHKFRTMRINAELGTGPVVEPGRWRFAHHGGWTVHAQDGLTGWAQVRYSYGASVEDALETVKTVLLRRGARWGEWSPSRVRELR